MNDFNSLFEEKARDILHEVYLHVDREGSLIGEEECVAKIAVALQKEYALGRASRELKLPDQLSILNTMAEFLIKESKKENTKTISEYLHDWLKEQIKALNECEGESGEG